MVGESARPPATGTSRTYLDLAREIQDMRPLLGKVRLVAVDGPIGAGKTHFSRRLAVALRHAPVVHLDHLYEGWSGLGGVGNRLDAWVLVPLRSGLAGRHLVYDWNQERYAEWREVPLAPTLIVEGTGAAQQLVDRYISMRVWIDAPLGLRLARAVTRDGERFREDIESWGVMEASHFTVDGTRARADIIVDGAPKGPHDAVTEFIALPKDGGGGPTGTSAAAGGGTTSSSGLTSTGTFRAMGSSSPPSGGRRPAPGGDGARG